MASDSEPGKFFSLNPLPNHLTRLWKYVKHAEKQE